MKCAGTAGTGDSGLGTREELAVAFSRVQLTLPAGGQTFRRLIAVPCALSYFSFSCTPFFFQLSPSSRSSFINRFICCAASARFW